MIYPQRILAALVLAMAATLGFFGRGADAAEFPLKTHDVVVMAGDSITAQHLHSNYIEAYCLTRFPTWNLRFRNSGVGGDTVPRVLARFDLDVACWQPTVVTVELGMNDSGGGVQAVDNYIKQLDTLAEKIKGVNARPAFFSSSPVNDGTTSADLKGRNVTIDKMSTALAELCRQKQWPCADQFHALLDLWGRNAAEKRISLGGDPIHPGAAGQLTMAYACLTGLGAPELVSSASIDAAAGKVTAAEKCAVKDLNVAGDALAFVRTDEALPMPIPPDARGALQLVPLSDKLNRFMLTVTGLKGEKYDVAIDGTRVATVTAQQLAAGWNMSELTDGPIAKQCGDVLVLISKKAAPVSAYRTVRKFQIPEWLKDPENTGETKRKAELDRLMPQITALDAELAKTCQPQPHRFEVTAAK